MHWGMAPVHLDGGERRGGQRYVHAHAHMYGGCVHICTRVVLAVAAHMQSTDRRPQPCSSEYGSSRLRHAAEDAKISGQPWRAVTIGRLCERRCHGAALTAICRDQAPPPGGRPEVLGCVCVWSGCVTGRETRVHVSCSSCGVLHVHVGGAGECGGQIRIPCSTT